MDRPQLPQRPVTYQDMYLNDIALSLRELVAATQRQAATATNIREPQGTPLPDDFPGKVALEKASIVYLESVPRTGAALTAVSGIGGATANQILTWFKTE